MALTILMHDRLTTVMIEIVLPVGKLPLMICSKKAVSCRACFNFSHLNSRYPALLSGNSPSPRSKCMSSIFIILMSDVTHQVKHPPTCIIHSHCTGG